MIKESKKENYALFDLYPNICHGTCDNSKMNNLREKISHKPHSATPKLPTEPIVLIIFSYFSLGALGLVNPYQFSFLCMISQSKSSLISSKNSD